MNRSFTSGIESRHSNTYETLTEKLGEKIAKQISFYYQLDKNMFTLVLSYKVNLDQNVCYFI